MLTILNVSLSMTKRSNLVSEGDKISKQRSSFELPNLPIVNKNPKWRKEKLVTNISKNT
jgi:hypothetical protein